MRLSHVFAALLLSSAAAAEVLYQRQDTTTTSTGSPSSTTTGDNASSTASSSVQSSATASSTPVTSSAAQTSRSSQTTELPSSTSGATGTTSSLVSVSLIPTASSQPNALPLQPLITPAVGIGGVLLLGLGAALCLVGIKHESLHIFISTTLLGSLAVTVLIIYVMNPPVKNAIQGAYLVAIIVTGLVLGAVSLIFKEVTEGLGCLLGGFCFAMWLSVLRPGGLISSTAGQAILIAVFCVAGLSLSFSRYTRTYGLIVLTSFAGAQVFILGVDCFSRAGLKEFWIYIWDLNDNEFPLNTNTYPITRGMKVEIACTVILFLFGVMSQLKIWRIVKERRAKRDAARLQDEERRDQLEQELGKSIEENNELDRAKWEAVYGDKEAGHVHVDSGVGSSISSYPKRSVSVKEQEVDAIEMSDAAGRSSKRGSKRAAAPHVTVRVASEEEVAQARAGAQSREHLLHHNQSGAASTVSIKEHDQPEYSVPASMADANETTSIKDWSTQRSSADPGPSVTPLPFSIPPDQADHEDSDQRSVGTAGLSVLERRRVPLKHLALKQKQDEDEKAGLPRIESDRASSIAATADEDVDMDTLSQHRLSQLPPSPYRLELSQENLNPFSIKEEDSKPSVNPRRSFIEPAIEEDDLEIIVRPPTALDEPVPQVTSGVSRARKREPTSSTRRLSAEDESSVGEPVNVRNVENLEEHLPEPMSKVAMIYRTNEWAKHAADALEPEPVSEPESSSPGVQVDPVFQQEAAKAAEEIRKPDAKESPALSRNASASSNNPYRRSMQPSPAPVLARSSSGTATPVYAFQRSSSQASLQRQDSNTVSPLKVAAKSSRNFSAPLSSQPLVESPIEEEGNAPDARNIVRNVPSAMSLASQSNLMDQRNDLLKRKTTTTSFNALMTSDLPTAGPSRTSPVQVRGIQDTPEDDMTLAQRKAILQQQRQSQQSQQQDWRNTMQSTTSPQQRSNSRQRVPTGPTRMSSVLSNNNLHSSNIIYDSHQPKRQNTVDSVRQSNMLTQWRASLQQESQVNRPTAADEIARQQMIQERRQAEYLEQKQQAERVRRESAADMAMRQGLLHGAHRDAMRKMQAKANRKTEG